MLFSAAADEQQQNGDAMSVSDAGAQSDADNHDAAGDGQEDMLESDHEEDAEGGSAADATSALLRLTAADEV